MPSSRASTTSSSSSSSSIPSYSSSSSHNSTSTYMMLPKNHSRRLGILKWVAGAPPNAHIVKRKETRSDDPDDRSIRTYFNSGGDGRGGEGWKANSQFFWVTEPSDRAVVGVYVQGKRHRSHKKKSYQQVIIDDDDDEDGGFVGAQPMFNVPPDGGNYGPPPPSMPMPMKGGFNPPPPPGGPPAGFGGGGGGVPPPGANPGFINVTGQNQPGNPFPGRGPAGGFPRPPPPPPVS